MDCVFHHILKNTDWLTFSVSLFGLLIIWRQLKASQKQLTLSNYSEYTRRYSEIIALFPEDINESSFILDGRGDYDKVMRVMRRYFDLSFEEFDLFNKRFIAPEIWKVWEGGIKAAMSKPAFQQAWEKIKQDTQFGVEFELLISGMKR
jgi:hypothetical protein